MRTASRRRILIIDDDPETCDLLTDILTEVGYRAVAATSGTRALQLVERTHPDLVLLDLGLREMDGAAVASRLKQLDPDLPIVILSGTPPVEARRRDLAVAAWLTKPYEVDKLLDTLRRLLPRRRRRKF